MIEQIARRPTRNVHLEHPAEGNAAGFGDMHKNQRCILRSAIIHFFPNNSIFVIETSEFNGIQVGAPTQSAAPCQPSASAVAPRGWFRRDFEEPHLEAASWRRKPRTGNNTGTKAPLAAHARVWDHRAMRSMIGQ